MATVSDVRPLVRVATYVDVQTGIDYYQEVVGKTFIPLSHPPSNPDQPNSKNHLEFLKDHSKFISYQEIKIQENQDEVPEGTTPRTLKFTACGNLCRQVKPGDRVVMSGICLTHPYTGHRITNSGLLSAAYVETMDVQVQKISYTDHGISDADLKMLQVLQSLFLYGKICFRSFLLKEVFMVAWLKALLPKFMDISMSRKLFC